MKKNLHILIALCLSCSSLNAQGTLKDSLNLRDNSIFFELFGNAGAYSLNYDHLFRLGESRMSGIGTRVGIAYSGWTGTVAPIEVYFSHGKKSCLELGLGTAFGYSALALDKYSVTMRIGYRYRDPKGFIFGVGPLVFKENKGEFFFYGGISFGYSF